MQNGRAQEELRGSNTIGASSCSTALEVYILAMLPHIFFLKKNENCLST